MLTKKQSEILSFISSFIEKNGYCPSYSEIGEETGMVKSRVFHYIRQLEERGAIEIKHGRARSIRIRK